MDVVLKVCRDCIGEEFLVKEIEKKKLIKQCSYCKDTLPVVKLKDLALKIDYVIRNYYEQTSDEPNYLERAMESDNESRYSWTRQGEDVSYLIQSLLEIDDEKIASDIQEILIRDFDDSFDYQSDGESLYSEGVHYRRQMIYGRVFSEKWNTFENRLKTESRFFGHEKFLSEIFESVEAVKVKSANSAFVEFGPMLRNSYFFRARVASNHIMLENILKDCENELGVPPLNLSKPGRMHAHGIGVLYGALSEDTALSEVRPPMGAQVVVAKFNVVRKIRLLDMNLLAEAFSQDSLFDPSTFEKIELYNFFKLLAEIISRPVMPTEENIDYLPTQVVSDYLATHPKLNIDGIIYKSTYHKDGKNIAIFSKTASVAKKLRGKTVVNIGNYDFEGNYENTFDVFEKLPDEAEINNYSLKASFTKPIDYYMELDFDDIKVYEIKNIEIFSEENRVGYYVENQKKHNIFEPKR